MTHPDTGPPPLATTLERWGRIDGCPECVRNYEAPLAVRGHTGGGFAADYRCTDCGHTWTTNWADSVRPDWML